jgi:hypothetical protein
LTKLNRRRRMYCPLTLRAMFPKEGCPREGSLSALSEVHSFRGA